MTVGDVLVVDLGTTGVRAMRVRPDGSVGRQHYVESPPSVPAPGMVEHDPLGLVADAEAAVAAVTDGDTGAVGAIGAIGAIGVTVQRATTVVWDASTGAPVGPAIGWQDLRTLGECLAASAAGVPMPPNASGSKAQVLVRAAREAGIGDADLRFGTLDTWLAWSWSGGALHVTDPTNAGVTAMTDATASAWDPHVLDVLGVPVTAMPSIVATSGITGPVRIGDVEADLGCLVGDQQASLVGQGGIVAGVVKATLGTAAMVDVNTGTEMPPPALTTTYPVVVASTADRSWYGREATVISAGEAVRGLVALGIAGSPSEVSALAAEVDDSGGVHYVPALLGLGTPYWDYGARATLTGMSLGTDRRHMCRAVLEGVAWRVAECVRAVAEDTAVEVRQVGVDGGAAQSEVLCQAIADHTGLPVARSSQREATAYGCALLTGLAAGMWGLEAIATLPAVERTFEPAWTPTRREESAAMWTDAVAASRRWIEGLSDISF